MMLTDARLAAETDTFHTAAQAQWREAGRADTTLVYVPERGEPTIQVLIGAAPPATADAARTARDLRAAALILTGEAWVAPMPTGQARLPAQDRPRPSEVPDRYAAIITTAVRTDGHSLRRATRVITGAFGRTLAHETLTDPGPNPDGLAAWLHEILTLATRRNT